MFNEDAVSKIATSSGPQLGILYLLESKPCNLKEIKRSVKPNTDIRKHLKFLEDNKLIETGKIGKEKCYKLTGAATKMLTTFEKLH